MSWFALEWLIASVKVAPKQRMASNPCESPNAPGSGPKASIESVITRTIGRVLLLSVVGYASFAAFGLLYWGAYGDDGQATIPWALSVGLLGAIAFPCSDAFNSGKGKTGGVVRRVLVTIGVLLASLIVSGFAAQALGWNARTYDSDPWAIPRDALAVSVFSFGLAAARIAWIHR